ncbi:methyltransferase MT-A70 family protein isoform X2 [Wolffia australiana]
MKEEAVRAGELAFFLDSGIYTVDDSSAVFFLDPIRILARSYCRYRPRRYAYYSRSFDPPEKSVDEHQIGDSSGATTKKRKRTKLKKKNLKKTEDLKRNEREIAAEGRHTEARPFLLNAHECFLRSADLLSLLPSVTGRGDEPREPPSEPESPSCDFVELGGVWQASLWEISLCFRSQDEQPDMDETPAKTVVPLFENPVANNTDDDAEAEFLHNHFILPRRSCFHMSDLRRIHDLIPANSDDGYTLIVIDPPWENASVSQKYPTLPSRHFLYIPVQQLAHKRGALVALWITNREKLRIFVEKELLPKWGITDFSILYWLKVKDDGSLIGNLDLFHHRPYECLILGYTNSQEMNGGCDENRRLPESGVIISVPGAHSRKPPLGDVLSKFVPRPGKSLELFARELRSDWTSWGNEPLRFQDSSFFLKLN